MVDNGVMNEGFEVTWLECCLQNYYCYTISVIVLSNTIIMTMTPYWEMGMLFI